MTVRLAFFGGIYSNHLALEAAIEDARRRGAQALYCLGDLGAFGPNPDRVFPLLRDNGVACIQGNYDNSIGNDLADCQCGYTDPRDNHFARISFAYTFANTSRENRRWLRGLPSELRLQLGPYRLLLCHGSPRRMNEFLWESSTSNAFLGHLFASHQADVILATHTGIKWRRELPGDRHFINVGVLGRPENDGRTNVWYALLSCECSPLAPPAEASRFDASTLPESLDSRSESPTLRLQVEFVPVDYDQDHLADELRREKLPEEFVETILTGWWTTCLEVLPAKERRRGKY